MSQSSKDNYRPLDAIYPLTYEVSDYCPIITKEETKTKRSS